MRSWTWSRVLAALPGASPARGGLPRADLPLPRRLAEAGVLAFVVACLYLWVGENAGPMRPPPAVPLDHAVPFVPGAAWLYMPGYAACVLLTAGTLAEPRAFRAAMVCFVAITLVACAFFLAWPMPAPVRPDLEARAPAHVLLRWVYATDPPTNTFPSLHVANAVMCAVMTSAARPALRGPAWVLAAGVAASAMLVRQHWIADVFGGVLVGALGIVLWRALLRATCSPVGRP